MFSKSLLVATAFAATSVLAQDNKTSLCDKYTTALLKDNTAKNQHTLLTLVVNTAVIGNYTQPNVGIKVDGILAANATYNGVDVNLAKYFDGSLNSTNDGGSMGIMVNFLTGGGAAPLLNNMAANDTTSPQYKLITRLYSYFGTLLGCSGIGSEDFPAYAGSNNMYQVHKFMKLDPNEVGYFIEQVGLSAASFGVATEDVQAVGKALNDLFGYRCSPEAVVIPSQPAALQSICTDPECPLASNPTCAAYSMNSTMTTHPTSPASGTGAPTATATTPFKGDASRVGAGAAAVLAGLAAFLL